MDAIGIDANVLVALAAEEYPSHSQAVAVFDRKLAADEQIVLSLNHETPVHAFQFQPAAKLGTGRAPF